MGQQQLLLIILGVIVVGIAVAVGITMFQDNAVSANRDAVVTFNGLSSDASGLKKLVNTNASPWVNANGSYRISVAGSDSSVSLEGLGNEIGNDGSAKVKVTMEVRATRQATTVEN
jgi:hypothetical protein